MSKIAIIGGCGRAGLRLSLVAANKGHNVTCIDIDEERINELNQGCLPFVEKDAEIYLEQALKKKTLTLSSDYSSVVHAETVIVTIGTPVDSNLNPSLEPIAGVIFDLTSYFKKNQLVIFRNTLSPGIINRIKILLEDKTGLKVGKNIFLAFAPELSNENPNIHDLLKAPQPIGAYDEASFKAAEKFFQTITKGAINWVSPEEALLAKLMKNIYAYVQNACANEFYLIAESYGANIHKILDASKEGENNIPDPSANSAGPGMHKEGWFLVDRIPFSELITTAFKINESIPAHIVQRLESHKLEKVVILGMTNKANSDDPRSSLSYKLRKLLYYKNYSVGCYDPYLPEYSDPSVLQNADAIILMSAHKEFSDLKKIRDLIKNPNCIFVDLGGFWAETKEKAVNGILKFAERIAGKKVRI